jgi:hypothetical protein
MLLGLKCKRHKIIKKTEKNKKKEEEKRKREVDRGSQSGPTVAAQLRIPNGYPVPSLSP